MKKAFVIGFRAANLELAQLIPDGAVQVLQDVMEGGELKGKRGWEDMTVEQHLARATAHIMKYLEEDTTEPHLEHAFTRLMMAVSIDRGFVNPSYLGGYTHVVSRCGTK